MDMIIEESAIKIVWKANSLKIGHFIRFEYELSPRMLDVINVRDDKQIITYFCYNDIIRNYNSNRFTMTLLGMHYITEKDIISIESYLP